MQPGDEASIDQIGLFDEDFGAGSHLGSGADWDFIFRAYLAGATLEYVPDMKVFHYHGRKTPEATRKVLRRYIIARGAFVVRYLFKHTGLGAIKYALMRTGRKMNIRKFAPDWFITLLRYRKKHGRLPRLVRPQSFNDKVLHRILFDRRAVLTQLADKAAVRSYVEARLTNCFLPEHYYVTDDPETIPFDQFPDRFVVKATHGSGWVQIVTDKSTLDRAALIQTCRWWLSQSYYEFNREWPYKHIKPRIVVEQFIDDGTGNAPSDYKLFVFNGAVEMIQVDTGRFTDHHRRLYSRAWEKLPALFEYDDIVGEVPAPPHLEQMIAAAETLGRDLDFIRADFYDTPDGLYFGELTTTPEAGIGRFRPEEFDLHLGRCWKHPRLPL